MISAKKDINHKEIACVFVSFGWSVIDTSKCHGVLLDFIAYKFSGFVYFVEVKNGNKKLTDSEEKFFKTHPYRSIIIRSVEDAIEFCTSQIGK